MRRQPEPDPWSARQRVSPRLRFSSLSFSTRESNPVDGSSGAVYILDRVHFPVPPSPLFATGYIPCVLEGIEAASETYWSSRVGREYVLHEGYPYFRDIPRSGDNADVAARREAAVVAAVDSLRGRWQDTLRQLDTWEEGIRTSMAAATGEAELRDALLGGYVGLFNAFRTHFDVTVPIREVGELFTREYRGLTGGTRLDAFSKLGGLLGSPAARVGRELDELGLSIADLELGGDDLEASSREEVLRSRRDGREVLAAFDRFARHSSSGIDGYADWRHATWAERRAALLDIAWARSQDADLAGRVTAQQSASESRGSGDDLRAELGRYGDAGHRCLDLYERVQPVWELNESHNWLIEQRCNALMHDLLLALGDALTRGRALDRADDVFFLHIDELLGPSALQSRALGHRSAGRRDTWAAQCRGVPPFWIGDRGAVDALDSDYLQGKYGVQLRPVSGDEMCGSPVSAGRARGRVLRVEGLEDLATATSESVVLCRSVPPALASALGHVAGILAESGGLLSHGAIMAREYGVPAVFGLNQAWEHLPTGSLVELDGSTGRVRRVED